jgi:hypothetical protein
VVKSSILSKIVDFPGYCLYRNDRFGGGGGGVGLYIRNDLKCEVIAKSESKYKKRLLFSVG